MCVLVGLAKKEIAMRKLQEPEYSQIWNTFYRRFDFRPSYGGPYPGINEPNPSIVFELPAEHTDQDVDEFAEVVRKALQHCAKGGEEVYYLDWHHDCYAFLADFDVPVGNGLPDGDYAIFLARDLSFGSFGHPWEGTICFFGPEFIEQILCAAPRLLSKVKRSQGIDGQGSAILIRG
jgi:hypothetical protein